MRTFMLVTGLVFTLAAANTAFAANSNVQVTPPPIAAPEFEAGKVDLKAGLTYISISGSGMSMSGYGANVVRRRALSDQFAWDYQVGFFTLNGDAGGLNASFFTLPLSLNVEYQPMKTASSSLILFAGYNYSMATLEIKDAVPSPFNPAIPWDLTMHLFIHGLQGGGQYSGRAGDFKLSPFLMIQSLSGSVNTYYGALDQVSSGIPSYTSTSFGLDILYLPWDMTLSSVLQQAAKAGSSGGVKTTIFTLSHTF